MMSCDEIFTNYLREASARVNGEFYDRMLYFTLLYRECLNSYGWTKLAESECRETKQALDEKGISDRLAVHKPEMDLYEFCEINNAEVAPEICNEFITIYLG